jgi:hypothetical protein
MAKLTVGFSVQFEIVGQMVPLESTDVRLTSFDKQELVDALKANIKFSLPADHPVSLNTGDFLGWLQDKLQDLGVTQDLTPLKDTIGGTTTITAFSAAGNGYFSIALTAAFDEGIMPEDFGQFINVHEIGLRLAYDPNEPDDS